MMTKLTESVAFALTAFLCIISLGPLQSQAEAADNYFVLRGGFAAPQDMDISASGGDESKVMSFDNGYTVGIAYGRRILPWLRGEIEVGWTEMDADTFKMEHRGIEVDDKGRDEHLYGMLNGLVDWQNDSAFTPYLGLGLGVAKATLENDFVFPDTGRQVSRDSSDTAFAYQLMLGLVWDVNANWGLELRGRYFASNDRTHDRPNRTTDLEADGSQLWMLDLGVSYKF